MTYYDVQQQASQQNPQQWGMNTGLTNPSFGQHQGNIGLQGWGQLPGLAAYGQQYGQYGGQQFGQPTTSIWGQAGTTGWGQPQRQLSQQEVGDVVRQLVPLLPQILAQAQQQPQAAFGYGFGQTQQRMLTQQDVNEVVRQILPIVPQIVGLLQGQIPQQAATAMYGGFGTQGTTGSLGQMTGAYNPFTQQMSGQHPFTQHPFAQTMMQQPFGQQGLPSFQAAFGGQGGWGQQSRQLTQQDVGEVVRQLVSVIPQVIGNLQSFTQQRNI